MRGKERLYEVRHDEGLRQRKVEAERWMTSVSVHVVPYAVEEGFTESIIDLCSAYQYDRLEAGI